MKIAKLTSLTDEAAERLLLPSGMAWQPWTIPEPKLPIDDFVCSLIRRDQTTKKSKAIGLKSKSELASAPLPILCPYHYARHAILMAFGRARMWVNVVDLHRKEAPLKEKKQKKIVELAKLIDTYLLEGLDRTVVHPIPLYSDRINYDESTKRADKYRALEDALVTARTLLQQHAEQISADRGRIAIHGNASSNVWKAAFAAALGYSWTNLTGRPPSLHSSRGNKDFRSFVTSAFISIGGNRAEKWDRTLRQVIHDRAPPAEWDGFDRYEKDRLPPGSRFITTEEWEKTRQRLQEQAELDRREIAEIMHGNPGRAKHPRHGGDSE